MRAAFREGRFSDGDIVIVQRYLGDIGRFSNVCRGFAKDKTIPLKPGLTVMGGNG